MSEIMATKKTNINMLFSRIERSRPALIVDANYQAIRKEWDELCAEIEKLNGEVSGDDSSNGNG